MTVTGAAPAGFANDDLEPVADDPRRERDRRRVQLALAYRLFGALRWGELGDGHITARDPLAPDHFWMLAHGVSFDAARTADIVLVAPDGTVDGDPRVVNRAGYHIHRPLHDARPDVVAAAHTHTAWGTPFSSERRLIEPVTQEATIFFEDHALFDDEEVQILGLDGGRRIAAALGNRRALILANHGLLTVGSSVADAVAHFVIMERVTEAVLKAAGARPIGAESARTARDALNRPGNGWRTFRWLTRRHLGVDPLDAADLVGPVPTV